VSGEGGNTDGPNGDRSNGSAPGPSGSAPASPDLVVNRYLGSVTKRMLDLVIGVPLAVVCTPVIAVLALGSAVSLRSWPIFVQERVGLGGARFRFVKIRSLPSHAPTDVDKYVVSEIATTRYGLFLRRTHLDELPQLYLVCAGSMSLVGPRPEMPALLANFDPAFARARTQVRPGCSGLWQISQKASRLIAEAPQYDIIYLANASLIVDLWITYRTVSTRLGHKSGPAPRSIRKALDAVGLSPIGG
jgi:lipopolysaccharide/colanic/teichoic acid biosynthesis glycosyltransferase